jgi:hypothetical protein
MEAASTHYVATWGGDREELASIGQRVLDVAARLRNAIESGAAESVAA